MELIVWPRGYFPASIGGNFIYIHAVNGKMMIVKKLYVAWERKDRRSMQQ